MAAIELSSEDSCVMAGPVTRLEEQSRPSGDQWVRREGTIEENWGEGGLKACQVIES